MAGGAIGLVTQGSPQELGATLTGDGVNFAVWSAHAEAIDICLFDAAGETEIARIALPGRTGPVFHGHVSGLAAGARYGLRAHGPFAPAQGHRFNSHKLLVDPYALALDRPFALHPTQFAYQHDNPAQAASFDPADSAAFVPKAVVTAPEPAPAQRLSIPWGETVIYELHVRGFTMRHPEVPEALRGTFAGLAHPAAVSHLKRLGVTAVELLPTAAWIDERHLPPLRLCNYWGYNPVAMMAPDPRLAPGGWAEVRAAVQALAAAGIETLLDVVFNHTGESDEYGPTLSLRGLDNASYYRLRPGDEARYVDDAGTGNTLALDNPAALRLAMDALRAWRRFAGVAGFRFDLATVLGRRAGGFDPAAPLLSAIGQDPELRACKLIAEPWDCGSGGHQLGRFPAVWGEWNDRYRDTVRSFWRGDAETLGGLATRLAGSQDAFAGRPPSRSVNFVVAHDGFTLADLVSFEAKQNQANGEGNRDGGDHNRSWNNGREGPTDRPEVIAARRADQRALLATLMLSRGTPMFPMGAELGQTQGGNNNAYAQDNGLSWLDWEKADPELTAFAARLAQIRRDHPALRTDRFLSGQASCSSAYPDVAWRRPDGAPLEAADWQDPQGQTLVMALAQPLDADLDRIAVAFHRGREAVQIALPEPRDGMAWRVLADSADPGRQEDETGDHAQLAPRSAVVWAEAPSARRTVGGADPEILDRLTRAAGIAAEWRSLDGERHVVSLETRRTLLASLQFPATTAQQARESLHRLAQDRDHGPLPQALAGRTGLPIEVPLRASASGPPPRTWLLVESQQGEVARLRATPELCHETGLAGADGRTIRAFNVLLPPLAPGRYTLRREDRPDAVCHLTVAPPTCYLSPAVAHGGRFVGLSAQLYSVRRHDDQGIGDFTTLGALGQAAAGEGCAVLGVNPLHMLFNEQRERASPYYPSDRRFLDPIYLDLAQVPFAGYAPAQGRKLAAQPSIAYPTVWAWKSKALEASFAQGRKDSDFAAFVAAGGAGLDRFATFQAIAEARPAERWRDWPEGLRSPGSPAVVAFARAHAARVTFHKYLQWLCTGQLAQAARQASGLEFGFCRDLAVGAAPDGAEAWAEQALLAHGAVIGAPPDPLAPQGQVWGLPPFNPHALRAEGYETLARLYGANMGHAGALRIDHVFGLARQFWVPDGADGSQGAYVDFPLDDLLGVVALESSKANCMVIGEDLGTAPHGFREVLASAGVLGYRVLPFERNDTAFKAPAAYEARAWACVATHDLPTLAGWWDGLDIDERLSLGLCTEPQAKAERAARAEDKQALAEALTQAGLIEDARKAPEELTPALAAVIHAYVTATPSAFAVAQVEDLAGERTTVNLPGTDRERPNWRRRLAIPLEELFQAPPAQAILSAMRKARAVNPKPLT